MIITRENRHSYPDGGVTPRPAPYVITFNGRLGAVTLTAQDVTNALGFSPGEPGEVDSSTLVYQHTQSVAETQWTVNHNLGRRPGGVTVLSPGFVEVEAAIVHTSENQLVVMFEQPYTGYVHII